MNRDSLQKLLIALEEKDIRIWVENDQLRFDAPKGAFTDDLKQRVRDNKAAIVEHLSNQSAQAIKNLYALSPMQTGMLFHSQLAPNSGTYIEHSFFHVDDPKFDADRFIQAIQTVIDHHDNLRAAFQFDKENDPFQVIYQRVQLPVTRLDWRDLPAAEYQKQLAHLIEKDRLTDFDFSQAPLLRLTVVEREANGYDLLLAFHHMLMDRWSADLFWSEVERSYGGDTLAQATPYQSYIRYVRQQPNDAAFWQEYLRGFSAPTPLPAATTTQSRGESTTIGQTLSLEATRQLTTFAREQGLTVNTLYQAAWAVLLARYGRLSDVLFGMVTSGRSAPVQGIESIIGLFINTLPLRVTLDDKLTGLALLQQVANTQLELQQREHTSLMDVQRLSELSGGTRLFESLLLFQNTPKSAKHTNNALALRRDRVQSGNTGYPLVALVTPGDRQAPATLKLTFDTARYDADTVERLLTHWQQLLMGLVSHPEQPVSQLSMLTEAEYHQIVHQWNDTAVDFGEPQTIHALFETQVTATPDAVAVVFEDDQLTYAELNAHANQLAHHLIELGVRPDILVAIAMERSVEMVVSLLAVLKAGGAYVPIDPTYPAERIGTMLADSSAAVVLTQTGQLDVLQGAERVIAVDGIEAQLASRPSQNPQISMSPEHLAYVIYTSGSTGRPKGVTIQHCNLFNLVRDNIAAFELSPTSRVMHAPTFGFDVGVGDLFMTLCSGATLYLPTPQKLIGTTLGTQLRHAQATHISLTPTALSTLPPESYPYLHQMIVAGEALPDNLAQTWLQFTSVWNAYGPTENTIYTTATRCQVGEKVHIGKPISNVKTWILDDALNLLPAGVAGELYIGGTQLAQGYLNRPELTAERFIEHLEFGRLYKTGDLCRWLPDGNIEYLGRTDFQVKIRGFRIELGEIESELLAQEGVQEVVVLAREDSIEQGDKRLVAYFVGDAESNRLREKLARRLPEYMVPTAFVQLDAFPLTPNGKLDRRTLPVPDMRAQVQTAYVAAESELQQKIVAIWQQELNLEQVGIHNSFFDLGGNSLLLLKVHGRLLELVDKPLPLVDLFRYPTIDGLCAYLEPAAEQQPNTTKPAVRQQRTDQQAIAIVGMAGRFPGADSIAALWHNLAAGVESLTYFSDEELLAAGVEPDLLANPAYVKSRAILSDIQHFDAHFFGFSNREAMLLDPQIRLFLECAWTALEDAGCDPERYAGAIGVFAGSAENKYMQNHIRPSLDKSSFGGLFQAATLNGKDFLTTRTSYKLNLTGPSITVQTACSTSLVATHMACQSLLNGDCDMALAGGVSLRTTDRVGYLYQDDMIASSDGHCRAFDVAAEGTFWGSGVGIVALKRLQDALDDGDRIHAVIKGSAINNDGSNKIGYTAPSVDGQLAVIRQALTNADVAPDTISYVETHGTGTKLGDPIELTALKEVFEGRRGQSDADKIVLGTIKTNFGHTNMAAGVAGLIKTALALKHQAIPPTLHFTKPNPELNFPADLFEINTELKRWQTARETAVRRAGVSSFGIGGTNAHVVLEEAPVPAPIVNQTERTHHLLTLSAKSEQALQAMAADYATFFATDPAADDLSNICYTAHVGRSHFAHRLSVVGKSPQQMQDRLHAYLEGNEAAGVMGVVAKTHSAPKIAFLFTGQGSQYIGMGQALYKTQPIFRATIDRCDEILQACLGRSLLDLIYPAAIPTHNDLMESHPCGQATNFAIECALADLWRSWGVQPDFVLGHSLGDFAAAYTAGVLSLEDGLRLVVERGRLMETALGSMVSVIGSEADVMPFLKGYDKVTIGVINGPHNLVISGDDKQVAQVVAEMRAAGLTTQKLAVNVAGHSPMLDSVLDDFTQIVNSLSLSQPNLPVVSSITGQLVYDELTDPNYWRQHLRHTVRFADGIQTLHNQGCTVYLEIGPKPILLSVVKQLQSEAFIVYDQALGVNSDADATPSPTLLPTLREKQNDWQQMLTSLAVLYTQGVSIDWHGFDQPYQRRKVQLPTYPFQRQRYWIDAPPKKAQAKSATEGALRPLIDKMIHTPVSNTTIFETVFSVETHPVLADYRISHAAVAPIGTQLSLLIEAADLALNGRSSLLKNLTFPDPLVIPEQGSQTVQLLATASANNVGTEQLDLKLVGFASHEKKPTISTAATGQLDALVEIDAKQTAAALDSYRQRCTDPIELAKLYPNSMMVGSSLRWLTGAWQGEGELLGRLAIPDGVNDSASYQIHPGLLESCFSLAVLGSETAVPYIPSVIHSVKLHQPAQLPHTSEWWCYACQIHEATWDVQLLDQDGNCLIEMAGVTYSPAPLAAIYRQSDAWRRWLYATHWEPMATERRNGFHKAGSHAQTWLIFADAQGACEALLPSAPVNGHNGIGHPNAILVYPGDGFQQLEPNCFTIRPKNPDDYRQLIATLPDVTDVVHGWGLDAAAVADANQLTQAAAQSCETALYVTQALLHELLVPPRLWLVTQGAQATNPQARVAGFAQSALWGLGRTISLEHPELNCVCIDLDETAELAAQMPDLYQVMIENRTRGENQIALRPGVQYVPRLKRYQHVPTQMEIHPDATYLITGGLGSIGLEIARWFVEQGATRLILLGRSRPNAAAQAKVEAMRELGAQVHVAQADVGDEAQLTAVFNQIPQTHPLRGIVHAAGVLDDAALLQQSWRSFENVFTPKVQGTWLLHSLTEHIPLDFFVLFSSAAGLLGNLGQANHAAANTFMDGLAHYRHALGLPALSINWQGWRDDETIQKQQSRTRRNRLPSRLFGGYSPQQGVQAFANLLNQSAAQIACMGIDWQRYLDELTRSIPFYTPLVQELAQRGEQVHQAATVQARSSKTAVSIHNQLLQLPSEEQASLLTQTLQGEIGRLLGIDSPDQVDTQAGLVNLGLDSLMAIELRNRLQKMLKIKIPIAKFIEDINLAETVQFLLEQFHSHTVQNNFIQNASSHDEVRDSSIATTTRSPGKVKEILI